MCKQVQNVANGVAAADGNHPYLKKVLDCLKDNIEDEDDRKKAAAAFKASLNNNERANDSALTGYNAKKKALRDPDTSRQEKIDGYRRLARKTLFFHGNPVCAGSNGGTIDQTAYDPIDGSPIPLPIKLTSPANCVVHPSRAS